MLCALLAAAFLILQACGRQDQRLRQHREKLESLGATTAAIVEAWLTGSTSGTFTRGALARTFELVEQERAALAAGPEALLDPRGAALSRNAEALSRLLSMLIQDVRGADAASARRRLAQVPITPEQP